MIRTILFISVLPLLMVSLLTQGGQLRQKGALGDIAPANWPSSSPHLQSTVPVLAELSVSKTGAPNPITAGSALTYTIIITNSGPEDATAVVLADALPLTVDFGSALASQGSCSQTIFVVTCNLNDLSIFTTATVTIVVTPTQAATIINTVAVASSGTEDADPGNNVATATTLVHPSPQSLLYTSYLPVILK